nr:MAG TPA: endonuclease-like protein [Bacteriophage sp.]
MKELAKINPEEVRKYYIDQHHSLLQTAKYFGRSQSGMEKFLKRNEIKKPAEEVALIRKQIIAKNYAKSGKKTPVNRLDWKMPGLEEIEEKYFSGMTQKQLAVFYRVSLDTIRSWLARYGIKKDQKDVEESRKASIRRHFGCDYAMQSAEVRKKSKETCLKKYGVDCYSKTESGRSRVSSTNTKEIPSAEDLFRYYVTERHSVIDTALHFNVSVTTVLKWLSKNNLSKTPEQVEETKKKTNMGRFGVENSFSSPEVREHYRKNCIEKYGFGHPVNKGAEKSTEILSSEEKFAGFLVSTFGDKPNYTMVARALGCSDNKVRSAVKKNGWENYLSIYVSSPEDELQTLLKKLNIDFISHERKILNGMEIDIYIPAKKIGIEFNGDYWHSDAVKEKNYHFNKSKLAESKGIRLIHIYEYEWNTMKDKIVQLLKIALGVTDNKIYARKCEVREITNQEAKILNDKVHLQNHRNAQVTYGLYYHDELVQLMSFSRTHYNRNLKGDNSWEIIRGCPGSNNIVVGGVSKLFSHFIKDHSPDEVFSYCDFNKFDGKSYEAIGMKFIGYTGPDKTYLINGVAYKRNPSKYKEYKEKAEAIIWGAGSKKYLWKKEESS